MSTLKLISLGLLLSSLLACSSAPTYREASGGGYGYDETRLASDRYSVNFKLRLASSARADNYALLRAAELTLLEGYDWFVVEQRETLRSPQQNTASAGFSASQQTPVVHRDCGLLGCSTHTYTDTRVGVDTAPTAAMGQVQETSLHIQLGKGIRPQTGEHYDARELRERLRQQLDLDS